MADKDTLIAELDRVARDTFAYFDGQGRANRARVDRWEARDVLMHFLYFNAGTARGIAPSPQGGRVWPVPASADAVNEVCRQLHAGESVDELLSQLRLAH